MLKKQSKTKAELIRLHNIKRATLVSRLGALGIEAETYVVVGPQRVALYSVADCEKLEKDLAARPVSKRGWPKGQKRQALASKANKNSGAK